MCIRDSLGGERVEAQVAHEGLRRALLGAGARLLGRLARNQLRVRDAHVAEVKVGQHDGAVECHVLRLLVEPRREEEAIALLGRAGELVRELQHGVRPRVVRSKVVVLCDGLLPRAIEGWPVEREPRQHRRCLCRPLVELDRRAAPQDLRYHPERHEAVARLPGRVARHKAARDEDGPLAVGALLGAIVRAGEHDVRVLELRLRTLREPLELRVVHVEHDEVRPHAQHAVREAHRVDHLVAVGEEQHARLIRQAREHRLAVLPKDSIARHIGRAVVRRGVRGERRERGERQEVLAERVAEQPRDGEPKADGVPDGAEEVRLRPESLLHLQVERRRGGQVGEVQEDAHIQHVRRRESATQLTQSSSAQRVRHAHEQQRRAERRELVRNALQVSAQPQPKLVVGRRWRVGEAERAVLAPQHVRDQPSQ
eukprot:7379491-Prymnesium_polylepis.1